MAIKSLNRDQVIALLKKQQGARAARALAEELGIHESYLSEIYSGSREPGPKVLGKLKLQKRVTKQVVYERVA